MEINQAMTAIECYNSLTPQHFNREEALLLQLLTSPMTISMIRASIPLAQHPTIHYMDKSSISRARHSLRAKGLIYICKEGVCPISHKRVEWDILVQKQLRLEL